MVKEADKPNVERFGGPGSSHQDREHPQKNKQPYGHKKGGGSGPQEAGVATNSRSSGVSGGGGERDRHHTHTQERS
jgi:hypothetical protein